MVATVVVMILFWQGRHFVGTVSLDEKLTLSKIQNRTFLILLETTSYNIHKPGSQTSMTLESAWLVHKMKKHEETFSVLTSQRSYYKFWY